MTRRNGTGDVASVDIPGFEIKRSLGRGGMASAYLAVQRSPNRLVALKVLHLSGTDELNGEDRQTLVERFRNEGELVSRLHHRNIVEVYGVGAAENLLYIYMEYVGGGDLSQRIDSGVHPAFALDVVTSIADALAFAHGRGVVHRDVKPSNILFRQDGTVLLTDFGIAKQLNAVNEITTIGMLLGSPTYMSTEQAEGRRLDGRTDLYSLGVILYEMLTGRPPFIANSPLRMMLMHSKEPVPVLPEDRQEFQSLVDALLAKDRDERIPDAHTLSRKARALRERIALKASAPPVPPAHPRRTGLSQTALDRTVALLRQGLMDDVARDRLEIPSPPWVIEKVRVLAERDDPDPGQLVALVGADAALSVQLLRAANAAFYHRAREVATVAGAAEVLGHALWQSALALASVSGALQPALAKNTRNMLAQCWFQSLRVSVMSERIALLAPARESGLTGAAAATAGLLHNIGFVPALLRGQRVPQLRRSAKSMAHVVGRVQGEVGAFILREWQLPADVVEAVAGYRRRGSDGADGRTGGEDRLTYRDVVRAAWRLDRAGDDSAPPAALAAHGPQLARCGIDASAIARITRAARAAAERWGREARWPGS